MSKMITVENKPSTFFLPARDLLAVWNAVSAEETRYYLKGVFVESISAGGMVMTATTGNILLTADLDERAFIGADVSTQADDRARGFILTLDTSDKALKAKARGTVWLYGDMESGIIQALDVNERDEAGIHARLGVVEFSRIDGTFPDYRRVMPACVPGEAKAPVCVNLDLLDDMRRAAALYAPGRGRNPVRITAGGSGDPMLVEFTHAPHLKGVIMPMRF